MSEISSKGRHCPNCMAELYGNWCFHCGQNQKPIDRFFFTLLAESFDDVFSADSRAARTLVALLFRPGYLTVEYFAGRRARYVPPLRLYLITSILFFSMLSLQNFLGDTTSMEIRSGEDEAALTLGEDWRSELGEGVTEFNIDLLSPEQNEALRARLVRQAEKAGVLLEEEPGALFDALIDIAPPVLFLFVPLFALLLKIVYLGTGRYYTEHLVLAVHNHSFLFSILIVQSALEPFQESAVGYLLTAIQLWLIGYMYLSLRTAYGEGHLATSLKFVLLSLLYWLLFLIALVFTLLLGVLTL